jgi:hypothetical protein
MLIGATSLETPSTIVFPQPWTNQAITKNNEPLVGLSQVAAHYHLSSIESAPIYADCLVPSASLPFGNSGKLPP